MTEQIAESEVIISPDEAVDLDGVAVKADGKFAVPANDKHPAKLPINDKGQIEGAITVVLTGQFRGNDVKPPLTDEEKAHARRAIAAAISESGESDDWKKQELDRLHGKSASKSEDAPPVDDTVIEAPGLALKAISEDASGFRIGGYLVSFGSPTQRDGQGEFFDKDTYYGLDWPIKSRPVLYHHSLKGDDLAIGTIDKLEKHDAGIWAEATIVPNSPRYEEVKAGVNAGQMAWSSGTFPQQRKYDPAIKGRLARWPIVEGSVTRDPVQKGATKISHLSDPKAVKAAYKAFSIPTDNLGLQDDEPEGGKKTVAPVNAEKNLGLRIVQNPKPEVKKMSDITLEQLGTTIADAVKAGLAAQTPAPAPTPPPPAPVVPPPPLPVEQPAVKSQVQVLGDRRFMDYSSNDMAFYDEFLSQMSRYGRDNPLTKFARNFVASKGRDDDKKFEREIAAKFYREVGQNKVSEGHQDLMRHIMPYKSMSDVEANNWRGEVVGNYFKANELDNSGQSGFGAEWIPTRWRDTVWERIRLANVFGNQMVTVPMPTNPFKIGIETTDPSMYYTPETTDAASLVYNATNTIGLSKVATNVATLTAKKLAGRIGFSMEESEDALMFSIPRFQYQLLRACKNAVDNTIVNGDTQTGASVNINLIDGTPATAPTIPNYIAFDGLLKYCILTNPTGQAQNAGGGAPTLALLRAMRKALLAPYSLDIGNLMYVCDQPTYFKMLSMPEFLTYMNTGSVAPSNISGMLPNGTPGGQTGDDPTRPVGYIDAVPVYVSAEMALANSAGKIPAAGGTLGRIVLVHRQRWYVGYRREIDFEAASLPLLSDVQLMQVTVRLALQSNPFDTQTTVVLYNIGV